MKSSQLIQEIAELQRRAEQRLSEQRPEDVIQDSDIHTLLHRLRVHQIELEMQNEALQQTREDTEAALERYTKLYDFAPIGYFTLDRDGTILQVNLAGADLLGIERSHLTGKHYQHPPNHCRTIVSIAHKLGIRAIAEGVETAAQRDLLVAAGCDYAQGYLFGMPVPEKDLRLE